MTDTTISILQDLNGDVTLYTFSTPPHDPHQEHYAMLGDADLDEDRLYDMLMGAVVDGNWKDYFQSSWYPLAFGKTSGEAMDNLVAKIRTVECESADMLVRVLLLHSGFIHDNFNAGLQSDLAEAFRETLATEA